MTFNILLHYSATCFCVGAAVFALIRDRRSFVHLIFALGMVTLALESFFTGHSAQAIFPQEAVRWQQWRFIVSALVPGIWLLFSLSFGEGNYRGLPAKWKWVVAAIFLLHLVFVTFLRAEFLQGVPIDMPDGWKFGLGRSGYGFYVCFLLSLVLILIILERILRAIKGRKRWQFKFLVLGIGAFFAARIYTGSHALVYQIVDLELEAINAAVLLVANFLILISILRAGVLQMDIYLSHTMLYNSLTAIVVGVYFSALGLSAKFLTQFLSFPLRAVFVFLALLVLVIGLLSDRLRLRMKRLVSRHLRRPMYDYRSVWTAFSNRTATLVEEKPLCESVAKMISEMFDSLSVSLWLLDEKRGGLRCAGSTALSETQVRNLQKLQNNASDLVQVLRRQPTLLDLEDPGVVEDAGIKPCHADFLREARIHRAVPMGAGDGLLGFICVGDRVKWQPFCFEELELLRTIASQVAASLLNLRLSERLSEAKEMEAFQTVSAFFVHDLKNLAAKLSMTLKNLPVHFDNPEFREDALRLMSLSVEQINGICSRLSLLREKLEIRPVEADLNQVVTATLASLNGALAGCVVENLQPLPKVFVDAEQIRKVLTNLILNARDAVGGKGEIRVTTGMRDEWAELTVKDNGCGMTNEFMDHSLFRPFRTTKPKGTGIGLFQSKMIVEAHKGLIEVESREGQGSTFRVLLPVKEHRA